MFFAGSEEEPSDEEEPETPPPPQVTKTPRVYECDAKEPDLTKQPKKSALKKTPVPQKVHTKKSAGDSVHINFGTPVVIEAPTPEVGETTTTTAQPSPKATPVNQGPPRPKPRITLLRYAEHSRFICLEVWMG